jgi:GNAT superfamily N-acetyltransferase
VAALDHAPVWSLSCFYVRKGYRRKGVAEALIGAALNAARRAKVPALEGYPLDAELTRVRPAPAILHLLPRRIRNGCAPGAASPDYAVRSGAKLARKG